MHNLSEYLIPLLGIVGVVFGAVIGGCFSLLSIVLSKETAVSEFRQAWINDLRADIASLVAHAMQIQGYIVLFQPFTDAEKTKDFWEKTRTDYIGLNQTSKSIQLRLNPHDRKPEAKEILEQLKSLDSAFKKPNEQGFGDQVDRVTECIAAAAQPLLKREWERVKKGEKVFRKAKAWSKRLILVFVPILILLFLLFLIRPFCGPSCSVVPSAPSATVAK